MRMRTFRTRSLTVLVLLVGIIAAVVTLDRAPPTGTDIAVRVAGPITSPPASSHPWRRVAQFSIDGNASLNDCTLAAAAALWEVQIASIGHPSVPPTARVIGEYRRLTGVSNTGVSVNQLIEAVHVGFAGIKVAKVASLTPTKINTEQAIWRLGGMFVVIGVDSAELATQPNIPSSRGAANPPWVINGSPQAQPSVMYLHAVAAVGYDQKSVYLATWGTVQRVSWAWWAQRAQLGWVGLPQPFVVHGRGPNELLAPIERQFFTTPALAIPGGKLRIET
jgi:hypothetical protein